MDFRVVFVHLRNSYASQMNNMTFGRHGRLFRLASGEQPTRPRPEVEGWKKTTLFLLQHSTTASFTYYTWLFRSLCFTP